MKRSAHTFILNLFSFVLFLFSFFIILFSCSQPTNPPVDNGPDTTSHNFSWTIDTIGTRNSYLKDVAIINENDIWAVGEIHTDETDRYDSLGNWQPPFNAVHWQGTGWELLRIPAVTSMGTMSRGPMLSVFAFASDKVWIFSQAGSYAYWNGSEWKSKYVSERVGSITKMWGSSSQDMYFVGTNGNITHYDGQSWQRLESGTDIDIQDIWGAKNPATGEYEIIAVASYKNYGRGMKLLKITGTSVSKLDTAGLHVNESSVWFIPEKIYYITGNGVFKKNCLNDTSSWNKETGHPDIYKDFIRGNAENDVFIVGSFGLVSHYNGANWKYFSGNELPSFYGVWSKCAVQTGIIAAVGVSNSKGIILRGCRN